MNTPDKPKQEELQHKLDQLYIYTGRSKDSPRIKPRDFDRRAKAIINSEVISALEKVKSDINEKIKVTSVQNIKPLSNGQYIQVPNMLKAIETIEKEYKS